MRLVAPQASGGEQLSPTSREALAAAAAVARRAEERAAAREAELRRKEEEKRKAEEAKAKAGICRLGGRRPGVCGCTEGVRGCMIKG